MFGEIMVGGGAHRAGIGGEAAGLVEHFLLGLPFEKLGTVLVSGEALGEFIAQGAREAGDFTVASHMFGVRNSQHGVRGSEFYFG
jgi:hypothetical protein